MRDTDEYKRRVREAEDKKNKEDLLYNERFEEKRQQALARVELMRTMGSSDKVTH